MNITLDGSCDHTHGIATPEIHEYFTDLLNSAGDLLYGRTTYKLMEDFWPTVAKNPTGTKNMDDFALAIDKVSKVLFSTTIKKVDWNNTRIATKDLKSEVLALRQLPGKDIFVGSPGLIDQLTKLKLIDEFRLVIHPVIAGSSGLPLFKSITESITLKLVRSQTIGSVGHILLCHQPVNAN